MVFRSHFRVKPIWLFENAATRVFGKVGNRLRSNSKFGKRIRFLCCCLRYSLGEVGAVYVDVERHAGCLNRYAPAPEPAGPAVIASSGVIIDRSKPCQSRNERNPLSSGTQGDGSTAESRTLSACGEWSQSGHTIRSGGARLARWYPHQLLAH